MARETEWKRLVSTTGDSISTPGKGAKVNEKETTGELNAVVTVERERTSVHFARKERRGGGGEGQARKEMSERRHDRDAQIAVQGGKEGRGGVRETSKNETTELLRQKRKKKGKKGKRGSRRGTGLPRGG